MQVRKIMFFVLGLVLFVAVGLYAALKTQPEFTFAEEFKVVKGRPQVYREEVPTRFGGGVRTAYTFEADLAAVTKAAELELQGFEVLKIMDTTIFKRDDAIVYVMPGSAIPEEQVRENAVDASKLPERSWHEGASTEPADGKVSVFVLQKDPNAMRRALDEIRRRTGDRF